MPRFAINAWIIDDAALSANFEESRRLVFQLRARPLPTFALYWLLHRTDDPLRYLGLGQYGDEEGTARLCGSILISRSQPASAYSATDVRGLRVYSVESSRL